VEILLIISLDNQMRTRFGPLFDFSKLSSVSGCMKFRNQRASGSRVWKILRIKERQVRNFLNFFEMAQPLVPSFETLKRTCGFQGRTGEVSEFSQVPRFV
jgi:hypothetical protein